MTLVGGSVVVDWMERSDLTHFFHVPGESFLTVLDALHDAACVRVVTTRHESGAAFAAEGYAKAAGRPAVCMATRGPGASNLSIGVQTAFYDGTPLIALLGLVPRAARGTRAFQEFEPRTLFDSIAKRVFIVDDVSTLAATLDQALGVATHGRPGPVVVGLPTDVLDARCAPPESRPAPALATGTCEWDAAPIADLMRAASRPALLVGTEAVRGTTATRLAELATATGLPVFASWRRNSSFDNGHPQFVGSLGLGASPSVAAAVSECDLLLSFGFALDQIACQSTGLNRPDVTVVQFADDVDPDLPRRLERATVHQVSLAPARAAAALGGWAAREPEPAAELLRRHEGRTARLVADASMPAPRGGTGEAHTDVVMGRVDALLPDNAVLVSDAGNFAQWLLRRVSFDRDRAFLGPVNGAMGYGLPAALGAALAQPSRSVWCVAGDGGFLMTACEMETAVRFGTDLVAVVVDNGVYGTIRARQARAFPGRLTGTRIGGIDFAVLASSHGWAAWSARTDAEVDAALAQAAAGSGCRLVHVIVGEEPREA
jgi:acetolactate synthase-1/2/3 large subunit